MPDAAVDTAIASRKKRKKKRMAGRRPREPPSRAPLAGVALHVPSGKTHGRASLAGLWVKCKGFHFTLTLPGFLIHSLRSAARPLLEARLGRTRADSKASKIERM